MSYGAFNKDMQGRNVCAIFALAKAATVIKDLRKCSSSTDNLSANSESVLLFYATKINKGLPALLIYITASTNANC